MEEKIRKDVQAWRKQLTPNQYYVTRQKGTEPPFTGEYEGTETPGIYKCVCCGQPLFRSETKYRSEEHTSELQSHHDLVCRLLLEKKKKINKKVVIIKYT